MDDYGTTAFGAVVTLIVFVLGVILVLVWTFLPFAVFGIKERIDRQTALSREILAELKALRTDQRAASHQPDSRSSS